MDIDLAALPDDVETLQKLVRSLAVERASLSEAQAEIERLRRQNERLAADLARNKAALEIMGKTHAFLQLLSENADHDPKSSR